MTTTSRNCRWSRGANSTREQPNDDPTLVARTSTRSRRYYEAGSLDRQPENDAGGHHGGGDAVPDDERGE